MKRHNLFKTQTRNQTRRNQTGEIKQKKSPRRSQPSFLNILNWKRIKLAKWSKIWAKDIIIKVYLHSFRIISIIILFNKSLLLRMLSFCLANSNFCISGSIVNLFTLLDVWTNSRISVENKIKCQQMDCVIAVKNNTMIHFLIDLYNKLIT